MDQNNKKYCLYEYQYIHIKEINKISLEILKEFVIELYKLLPETEKYFNNPYRVIGKLDEIFFVGEYYYQATNYILDLSNNNEEMVKYYYKDAWDFIIKVVYYKRIIIKQISKKMIKSLRFIGQKEMCKIRTRIYKKLEKLQAKLDNLLQENETE